MNEATNTVRQLISEINREKKRNAILKDAGKQKMDIPELPECALNRITAHIRRRTEKQTKNKWIRIASAFTNEIVNATDAEKEQMARYLQSVRQQLDFIYERILLTNA